MKIARYCSDTPGRRRRICSVGFVLILMLALVPAAVAHADGPMPVLDQSFTAPGDSGAALNDCCRYVAQTFTAGMTGALTAVSLDVVSTSAFPLKVSIHGVTNGLPNGSILSDVYVWGTDGTAHPDAPLSLMVNVGIVYVQRGHKYAVVVDYDGSGTPGHAEGNWNGASGNRYTRGTAYATNDESFATWTALGTPALDLHFKTYVVPGVPVSDLSIQRVRGATVARACHWFSETYRIKNHGPDTATHVGVYAGGTDQFDPAGGTWYAGPFRLAPGQSRLITIHFKVTAFVPGESRQGRVNARVASDVHPNIAIDPHGNNDWTERLVLLVGRPALSCR